MSEDNIAIGRNLYAQGDAETRQWFERQWSIWPKRANDTLTTNISLHYGGVVQFRAEHGREPALSEQFADCVAYHDKWSAPSKETPA